MPRPHRTESPLFYTLLDLCKLQPSTDLTSPATAKKMSATSFHRFYDAWFDQLHQLHGQLLHLLKTPTDHLTRPLVDKVMDHFTEFYRVKSLAAEFDVLSFFSAPWASSLERSLHWVTGFRPTTIFHLVYTESSARFGSHVVDILRGKRTEDLGELTPGQLGRVSDLQCDTVRVENEISGRLSEWQDELVGVDWAVICGGKAGGRAGEAALEGRVRRLTQVVAAADELRLLTLRNVVELLTPKQAAEFMVAATELLFGVRAWGLHQDRLRGVV